MDHVGLPLHAYLIRIFVVLVGVRAGKIVRAAVTIVLGERIAEFDDREFLLVLFGDDLLQLDERTHRILVGIGTVRSGAPERIVRAAVHVVVQLVFLEVVQRKVGGTRIRVHEVYGHLGAFRGILANGLGPFVHQVHEVLPLLVLGVVPVAHRHTAQTAVRLIAKLHHAKIHAVVHHRLHHVLGEVIHVGLQLVEIVSLPCFRRTPRRGIEIVVMQVEQHLHAILRGFLGHAGHGVEIVGAAAVAVAVLIIRIVEQAQTHPVHAVVMQDLEQRFLLTVEVLKPHSGLIQRLIAGHIGTAYGVFGHRRHLLHRSGLLGRAGIGARLVRIFGGRHHVGIFRVRRRQLAEHLQRLQWLA